MSAATDELGPLRQQLADGCRVLAARGLAEGYLGHISLRIDEQRLLIRCRGPAECGLAWITPADIHLVTLDGQPGARSELDGWTLPNELPLHTEVLRAAAPTSRPSSTPIRRPWSLPTSPAWASGPSSGPSTCRGRSSRLPGSRCIRKVS